jgi:hypothetical protein
MDDLSIYDEECSRVTGKNMKTIPYFDQYIISDCGEFLYRRRANKSGEVRLNQRKYSTQRGGYKKVSLYRADKGNSSSIGIARLVLFAHKELPKTLDMEADHIDFNPSNNHVSNLQWLTRKENNARKVDFDRQNQGTEVNTAKFDDEQAEAIFKLLYSGASIQLLSTVCKVSDETIRSIGHGKSWKHIHKKEHMAKFKGEE